ncbi:HAD-IA family hydrolase [Pseudooceanicola sp. C21-150M6]|uniref:HAD-IA family hydrolase n=1 Tax=Pseudooceanicola sp. C21-150M6 TaxID=3434355 RepID=UPI003D7F3D48
MTRLVIFDVDGTLVDSQADILASMTAGFASVGMAAPAREAVLGIVGLSLDHAMLKLAPEADDTTRGDMVEGYKRAYQGLRMTNGAASSPLYPGIAQVVAALSEEPETLLAIATGKSRRGLLALIDNHGWDGVFQSIQVADDHPSKPHPSMVMTALAETGVAADRAVMIGDTTYDMEMARGAGVPFLGVSWGYHPPHMLAHAAAVAERVEDLPALITRITGAA